MHNDAYHPEFVRSCVMYLVPNATSICFVVDISHFTFYRKSNAISIHLFVQKPSPIFFFYSFSSYVSEPYSMAHCMSQKCSVYNMMLCAGIVQSVWWSDPLLVCLLACWALTYVQRAHHVLYHKYNRKFVYCIEASINSVRWCEKKNEHRGQIIACVCVRIS